MLERNWKHQWLPLCLARQAKKCKHGETRGKTSEIKSKLACTLEASESTRMRMEEYHIAGGVDNSLRHYNLVTQIYSKASSNEDTRSKSIAVDKEWEKLEKIPAWEKTKVRNKSEVIDEARTTGAKVHFASLMDICHLKELLNWRQSTKNTKVELYSEATL